jgi:hypothetical protein
MAAIAMETKVQKMLNLLGRTNFAAVAMEIKKGGFLFYF